jgi:hypothetical protein
MFSKLKMWLSQNPEGVGVTIFLILIAVLWILGQYDR